MGCIVVKWDSNDESESFSSTKRNVIPLTLINTGIDVIFRKSSSLPDVEMAKGPEHATEMGAGSLRDKNYEPLLDKSNMVQPICVDGATDNPIESSQGNTNINIIDPVESNQSSMGTSSITSLSETSIYTVPKWDICHKQSTTGFPNRSNPYGDGVSILGFRSWVQTKSKVRQRFYSSGPDAEKDGTESLSKLIKLNNGKFSGLYKILCEERILVSEFHKLKNKLSGSFLDKTNIWKLLESLRDETFTFKGVERSKIDGKISLTDTLILELMQNILEVVFETSGKFSYLRNRLNCNSHTVFKDISKWKGITWMIKGEIKGSFHKTNYHILAKILQENIEDQQFIDLYWKLVKAGYGAPDLGACHGTEGHSTSLTGSACTSLTGSAGGINTILSDIYLNKFDKFISDIKIPGKLRLKLYARGLGKSFGPCLGYYNQLTNNKVYNVRYANKWLIGITAPGNKQLSLEIKEKVQEFLKDEISLDLEKTQITNITKNQTKFLGVLMTISKMEDGNQVKFLLPVQDIIIKLYKEGYLKNLPGSPLKINAITKWIYLEHKQIITRYNTVIRGLLNNYSFVDNYNEIRLIIDFILRHSCAKTLARKFNLRSRAAAFKAFGKHLNASQRIGFNLPNTCIQSSLQDSRWFNNSILKQ